MNKKLLISLPIAISVISVLFLYKSALCLNFTFFSTILAGGILLLSFLYKRFSYSQGILLILFVLISIPFSITTYSFIRFISFLIWLFLLMITFYSSTLPFNNFRVFHYFFAPIEIILMGMISPLFPITRVRFSKKSNAFTLIFKIILGLIIALPLLLIFTLLLSSGDLVFRDLMSNLFSLQFIKDFILIVIWFAIFFWFLFGALYYSLVKKSNEHIIKSEKQILKQRFFIETVTIFVLIGSLFLFYNILQITYLFGGERLLQNGEYSYAEYAKKGFFELIIVVSIALSLIGILLNLAKSKTFIQNIILRSLGIAGLLSLLPMTISSFYRLFLYEQEFGFTRLRISSHAVVIFLSIIIIYSIIKLLLKFRNNIFLFSTFIFTIFSIFLYSTINIDSFIVNQNFKRFEDGKTEELDIEYLASLSYDAIPSLVSKLKTNEDSEIKNELGFYLEEKLDRAEYNEKVADWRAWNLRNYIATQTLKKNKDIILEYANTVKSKHISDYLNETTDCIKEDCGCTGIRLSLITGSLLTSSYYDKSYDNVHFYDYNSPKTVVKVENIQGYDCWKLSLGEYYVKISPSSDSYINSQYLPKDGEIFHIKVEDSKAHVFLVSRYKIRDFRITLF